MARLTLAYDWSYQASPSVELEVWQESQSIGNNTSKVGYSLKLYRPSSISSSASKDWSINIGGNTFSGTTTLGGSGSKTIKSGYVTINHNSNGTKEIYCSFSLEFSISWSGHTLGTASDNGSLTLDTIPRKSSLNVGNGTIGSSHSGTISKAYSGFTSTLTWSCGSYSGTILNKSSATSFSWTPSMNLCNSVTSATSITCTFTLTTYNGNTSIGSVTKSVSLAVPSSVKPSISSITVRDYGLHDNDTQHKYDAYNATSDFIRGYSKLKVTISASTSYGSAIQQYKVVCPWGTYTSSSSTIDCGYIPNSYNSQNMQFSCTVTDKRGRTATSSTTKQCYLYNVPRLTLFKINRCDRYGNDEDTGGYCKITYSFTIDSINNKNSKSLEYKYKQTITTQWTESTRNVEYIETNEYIVFEVDDSHTYNIAISISDDFSTVSDMQNLSTAFVIMHFNTNGTGMGIGKLSELPNTLDIGMDIKFRGNMMIDDDKMNEQQFRWFNQAYKLNQTYEDDGVYPHACRMYGANQNSPVGIGFWDNINDDRILAYVDDINYSGETFLTTNQAFYFHNKAEVPQLRLNTTTNIDKVWTNTNTSSYRLVDGYVLKWGCVVQLTVIVETLVAINNGNIPNVTIGNVKSGFRPLAPTCLSGGGGGAVQGYLYANGNVSLTASIGTLAAGNNMYMSATYISDFSLNM